MRARATALAVALAGLVGAAPAGAAVRLAPVGTFERPTYVAAPPGDTQRVMVVEQTGRVRLLKDGALQPAPFLDLTGLSTAVPADPGQYSERGLFSIAFSPDYASSGLVYAFYTAQGSGALRVDEFRRGANPDRVEATTRRGVLEIPHDRQDNHNGGQLQFGVDGMLYVGTGDGGAGNDPADNGQNLTRTQPAVVGGVNHSPLLGKILRIDPRGGVPYAVPDDNPFGGPAAAVWALGLRNPYRFSFDRLTDDLVVADVGQSRFEEVSFAPAGGEGAGRGANFGWKPYEGLHTAGGAPVGAPPPDGFAFPVVEHPHTAGWCSITGGYVVRDPALPDLAGQYVYGDFCLGRIHAARLAQGGATDVRPLDLPAVGAISSFGEDACGRVYVASLNGSVQRLADSGACVTSLREGADPSTQEAEEQSGGGGGGGAGGDRRAPVVALSAVRAQRALRLGFVRLRVRCGERCSVRANGRVDIARTRAPRRRGTQRRGASARAAADRPLRVRTRRARLAAGVRTTLRLRIARSTRRRIARALRRPRRTATAVLTVRAADAAGNAATKRLRVRVVRRLPRR